MRRFIWLFGIISFVLDFYVFQGLKQLTKNWRNVRLRKAVHVGYWVFFTIFYLCFGYVIYLRFATDHSSPFMKWVMNAFLTFFVTKLVFVLFLLFEDIVRGLIGFFNLFGRLFGKGNTHGNIVPGRRKFVSQLGLFMASIPFAGFLYGMAKGKYAYTVHRQTLYFEDLPAAFDGFTITQLSDVHAGSFDDAASVQRGIDLAKAQNSDLFVFTGDLVNDLAMEIQPYMKMFGQLKAPFGQFSILGNHDYGMYANWPDDAAKEVNLNALKHHHAEMGYRLLLDENKTLEKNGEKIALIGVENWGKGFIQIGDLDKALQNVDKNAFKILLSHDPSHWEEVVKKHDTKVHLTLSGHTHGMQFGVETPLFKWSPVQYRYKNWAGLAEENGRKLYVNRGFGFIGFSGRVGIWPEITVLELKRGKANTEA